MCIRSPWRAVLAHMWSQYPRYRTSSNPSHLAKKLGGAFATWVGYLVFLTWLLQKYTVGSTGIWDTIRKFFAIDPNRSSGVPLNPQYRNPPPGALDPNTYDDPTTVPAADIADNPYWRRDVRRSYPQASAVTQGDVVGLLSVGSAANPSQKLLAGTEGSKQLVAVKQEGEEKGLASFFEQHKAVGAVLGEGGMPPFPVPQERAQYGKQFELLEEQSYENQ